MSTTTQILFNSPALHSLKRDQLVKLCKIHSLKASGKNKDIIARLQLHARTLPPEAMLDADEDDGNENQYSEDEEGRAPRPSEQWEVVMDSIAEVDEDSLSTLRNKSAGNTQAGEFGTAGPSTKSSSVTSSIKAIASSLGLKRTKPDVPVVVYAPVVFPPPTPPPEDPVEPIPGHPHLPGLPAPSNARLSMTHAPTTTTIRLVSTAAPSTSTANPDWLLSPPKLKPFATTFDLAPPTPGRGPAWPMSPGRDIYPAIPNFGEDEDMEMDDDVVPGGIRVNKSANGIAETDVFSQAPHTHQQHLPVPQSHQSISRSSSSTNLTATPFIFGSPNPQHTLSNNQFRSAAQSVLDEMNKRLADDGIQGLDLDVLERKRKLASDAGDSGERSETCGDGSVKAKFDRAHEREFEKMGSITGHYAAKRGNPVRSGDNEEPEPLIVGKKRKSSVVEPIQAKKRKSSVVIVKNRGERKSSVIVPKRVVSGGNGAASSGSGFAPQRTKKIIPGGFGDEDEDEEKDEDGKDEEEEREGDRRASKRPRFDAADHEKSVEGKIDHPVQVDTRDRDAAAEADAEEIRKQRERDNIRRRLDYNRAKRRSSMGRPSLGRPSLGGGAARSIQKPKPGRFGFLSSAKSLVQNVWNRGAGPSTAGAPSTSSATNTPSSGTLKSKIGQASNIPVGKAALDTKSTSIAGGKTTGGVGVKARVPSSSSTSSRAPVSSFGTGSKASSITGISTKMVSRAPSIAGTTSKSHTITSSMSRAPSITGKTSLAGPVSSMGMRGGSMSSGGNANVSSMGTRRSTLMAPTASSLAKVPVVSQAKATASSSSLSKPTASGSFVKSPPINPGSGSFTKKSQSISRLPIPRSSPFKNATSDTESVGAHSPRGKIFSQPLMSPLGQTSFGAAAITLASTTSTPRLVGQSSNLASGSGASTSNSNAAGLSSTAVASTKPPIPPKPKILPGRRPRISRSKVIARLAEQRAETSSTNSGTGLGTGINKASGKTRSSMGAGKVRSSMGVSATGKRSMGGGGDILWSAKKRARQSEYARRKSVKSSGGGGSMIVDE
ncbi:hypothetical protein BJ138DRAFT_1155929 [Hygrophoropsis aurantiaca]|uniref:Uncharacterized protein n=1 Tax=Hygrophoropsis aurantiaca TaxID=72124 RepID=A0ACB8A7E4_9AGAM|nr:hypothetical protein BJ138DRAFT_1155929 [Hygrophoropsis aurantiaca]